MGFSGGIRLGTVMGIPIILHPSWFLVLGLVIVVLSGQLSAMFPFWSASAVWPVAVLTGVLFFASVLIHELSHSLLALYKGLPVRGITLFMLGGVSQIAREANCPLTELLIAVAGPLSSVVLGGVLLGAAYLARPASDNVHGVLVLLGQVNITLGVFNMAPAFPLDGGRVLRATLWGATHNRGQATVIAVRLSQAIAAAMMLGGLVVALFIIPFTGIWMAIIGWFVYSSATGALRQQLLEGALQGLRAGDIMVSNLPAISEDESLAQAVVERMLRLGAPCLLVLRDGQVKGVVTISSLRRVPRREWAARPVGAAAVPLERVPSVDREESAVRAVELLADASTGVLLVTDGQGVAGALTGESVRQRLLLMRSLGMTAQ